MNTQDLTYERIDNDMPKEWKDRTDDELTNEAQTGLRGQGATVEMMRRLRDALTIQQRATNRLTVWLIVLTVVLIGLALFEVIMFFWNK